MNKSDALRLIDEVPLIDSGRDPAWGIAREALRRSEKLEAVAKAAGTLCGDWDLEQFVTPCACGETMPGKRQFIEAARALNAALSALNGDS